MPAWSNIKEQVLKGLKAELSSQVNWDTVKQCFADDAIDEYIIIPLLTKLNIYLKNYVIVFISIHILIISLIIFNIFICLYRRR